MSSRCKYPRTYHLPWSPGATKDDKVLSWDEFKECILSNRVVVTEKLDGENTTMHSKYIHARSTTSAHHPSRSWVKSLWASIKHQIPNNWRICGENIFAKHSISYDYEFDTHFLVFSVWDNKNVCLNWNSTEQLCQHLGLQTVPVWYKGKYNQDLTDEYLKTVSSRRECEGYVIRPYSDFPYEDFTKLVAKWVRNNHVQTDKHWLNKEIERNKLKSEQRV